MLSNKILLVVALLIFLLLLSIPLISKLFKSRGPIKVTIEQGLNPNRKFCHNYPVACDGQPDDFCSKTCLENMEYSCQNTYDVGFDIEGKSHKVTSKGKFCLPEKRAFEYPCEPAKGCVPTWSGWGSTNRMEWDSICMYPNYFGGNGCQLTPGVCELDGVSYMKDRDYSQIAPSFEDCVLPPALEKYYKVIRRSDNNTPLIVLKTQCPFYFDVSPGGETKLPDQCTE